jgi:hypothetical protein
MRNAARTLLLVLPLVLLSACAGDVVNPTPPVRAPSMDQDPVPPATTPPAAIAGGNTMGSGT